MMVSSPLLSETHKCDSIQGRRMKQQKAFIIENQNSSGVKVKKCQSLDNTLSAFILGLLNIPELKESWRLTLDEDKLEKTVTNNWSGTSYNVWNKMLCDVESEREIWSGTSLNIWNKMLGDVEGGSEIWSGTSDYEKETRPLDCTRTLRNWTNSFGSTSEKTKLALIK